MCIWLKRSSDRRPSVRNMNDVCNQSYKVVSDSLSHLLHKRNPPLGNVHAQLCHAFCDGKEGVLVVGKNVLFVDEDATHGYANIRPRPNVIFAARLSRDRQQLHFSQHFECLVIQRRGVVERYGIKPIVENVGSMLQQQRPLHRVQKDVVCLDVDEMQVEVSEDGLDMRGGGCHFFFGCRKKFCRSGPREDRTQWKALKVVQSKV